MINRLNQHMGKFEKIHWVTYCLVIFLISRGLMFYQYNLASELLLNNHQTFTGVMCKWDCKWYLTIINNGYDLHRRTNPHIWRGLANWAFFPLYPYTVKFISYLFKTPIIATGITLNQFFILIASLYFYKYLKLFFNEKISRFGVFLLVFSPFSVYFSSLYTEALFITLSIISFYYLRTNNYLIAAITGALLSATRPVGVMFASILMITYIRQRKIFLLILVFVSLTGIVAYMSYLYNLTGDPFAFKHIQTGWGRNGWQLNHLDKQINTMIKDSHNFILFIMALCISLILMFNKFYEESLFNLLCVLPGISTGSIMSEGRFSGTVFTFYLGMILIAQRSKTLKIIITFLFLIFYLSYYLYWMGHANFLI